MRLSTQLLFVNAVLQGKQYWANERRLCRDMLGAQADHAQNLGFNLQDVHSTSEGKSFDYRVGFLPRFSSQEVAHASHVSFTSSSTMHPAHVTDLTQREL